MLHDTINIFSIVIIIQMKITFPKLEKYLRTSSSVVPIPIPPTKTLSSGGIFMGPLYWNKKGYILISILEFTTVFETGMHDHYGGEIFGCNFRLVSKLMVRSCFEHCSS